MAPANVILSAGMVVGNIMVKQWGPRIANDLYPHAKKMCINIASKISRSNLIPAIKSKNA